MSAGPHWYARPEWWVVVIAGLTLLVLWNQANEMKQATLAMNRSSGILMDTEQGRILTYWERLIHPDYSPSAVQNGPLSHHFNWRCGNVGKSPVKLTEVWARFIAVEHLSDLPTKPDYSSPNAIVYHGEELLPSTKREPQTKWFSTPLETVLSYDAMEAKHRNRECVLYAYGYARYVDVWHRPHETRFGIFYDSQPTLDFQRDNWVVAGPSEYNQST